MVFEKSCGAVVFRDELLPDGEKHKYVLMIRQSPVGKFSFPKGHVEPGESEIETAQREVFEETAVRIEIADSFRRPVYYSPRPGAKKEVVYFVAVTSLCEVSPRKGEICEVRWVDVDRAPDMLAHSNDKRVFSMALDYVVKKQAR